MNCPKVSDPSLPETLWILHFVGKGMCFGIFYVLWEWVDNNVNTTTVDDRAESVADFPFQYPDSVKPFRIWDAEKKSHSSISPTE